MALIDGFNDGPRHPNPNCLPGVQKFLAYLEAQVVGEPGRPRAIPEPFEPVEAFELVDGSVAAPPPEKPKRRKRKLVRKADMPAPDRDAVNLKNYARKLRGEL